MKRMFKDERTACAKGLWWEEPPKASEVKAKRPQPEFSHVMRKAARYHIGKSCV